MAQDFTASYSKGPVLEIYPKFPKSSGSKRFGFTYFTLNDSLRLSDRAHNHPFTGIKASYFDLGSDVLGNAYAIQYQFIKHLSILEHIQFLYGLNFGVVLFDNPYNYKNNPDNIAVGSNWSFMPELILGLRYRLSDNISTNVSFNFYHTSNGHAQLPNVGINVPSYQLSLNYHLQKPSVSSRIIDSKEWSKKWFFNTRLSLGINEYGGSTAPTNGPKNNIYLISVYTSRRYSPKGFFQIGFDAYYNSGYRKFIISQDIDEVSDLEDSFVDASAFLVFIGHEYIYRHIGMLIQAGFNIHNPYLKYYIENDNSSSTSASKALIPGKFGLKYYLKNPATHNGSNISLGLFIKSNVSQADFLEFGLGFRI